MEIISGIKLRNEIRVDIKEKVASMIGKYNVTPKLVVVIVGEDPASHSYVKSKKNNCEKVGMISEIIALEESITEDKLLSVIEELNNDDSVHGVLVQLPLPSHINEDKVIDAIDYKKDVDGFHPVNVAAMHMGRECIIPATPKGIITMLHSKNIELSGKKALVIGRSNIVGKPVASLLLKENATVTIAHSRTKDLKKECLEADIIVAAVGRASIVTEDMVKEGTVVIDVGVNRVDGKLVGDVDFEAVKDKCSYITPVPGGVGPMTIASLLQNTLLTYERIMNND